MLPSVNAEKGLCQTFAVGWKEGTRVSIESMEDGAL
jgi:hypothetical protein